MVPSSTINHHMINRDAKVSKITSHKHTDQEKDIIKIIIMMMETNTTTIIKIAEKSTVQYHNMTIMSKRVKMRCLPLK